jgi:hypothetical protein
MSVQLVNGYPCHDCTEIDLAKKGIDPARPKDGPYGRDKVRADAKAAEREAARTAATTAATPDPMKATTGSVGRSLDVRG